MDISNHVRAKKCMYYSIHRLTFLVASLETDLDDNTEMSFNETFACA